MHSTRHLIVINVRLRICPGLHPSLAEIRHDTVRMAKDFKEVLRPEMEPWEKPVASTSISAKGAQAELVLMWMSIIVYCLGLCYQGCVLSL